MNTLKELKKEYEKEFIDKCEERMARGSYFADLYDWITSTAIPFGEKVGKERAEKVLTELENLKVIQIPEKELKNSLARSQIFTAGQMNVILRIKLEIHRYLSTLK